MPEPATTDEALDRLLSLSNPYPPAPRGLSARAEADLARITSAHAPEPARSRLWTWGLSLPAVAGALVALVVIIVANPFTASVPAAAMGLRPLAIAASDLDRGEAIDRAQTLLAEGHGITVPLREATTVAWYSHVMMDGPDKGAVISPEVTSMTWDADAMTAHIVVESGEPYRTDGGEIPTREDLSPPGTILRDDHMGAEALTYEGPDGPLLFPTAREGSGVDFYRGVFQELTGQADVTGFDVLTGIDDLLGMWTLTNEQHGSLLEILREHHDIELLGTTRDRAGRDAMAFGALRASGDQRVVLLVSTETGRIIGSESMYLGDDPDVPIPSGSVMSYQLWEIPRDD
ncbi:hypothetical protein [Microbacterium ulmi]|uniref:CU044_5270 family protein n=1 Tax=Microbacterium ulmi TaxID=179095 RepID=A0A7Y2LZR0_9MICO|nr:hypothetical protein [Microbacterium ulmi]NII69936.1 hypothetical protein [Microbacterium ulmi]NNH03856.1 hypothetical protein [Microbacterium ulmi]